MTRVSDDVATTFHADVDHPAGGVCSETCAGHVLPVGDGSPEAVVITEKLSMSQSVLLDLLLKKHNELAIGQSANNAAFRAQLKSLGQFTLALEADVQRLNQAIRDILRNLKALTESGRIR